MKITGIETIRAEQHGNLLWVLIETDEGLVGHGETFRNAIATEAYIHETCAPYLLGKDPRNIERHANALMNSVGNRFIGYPTRSVETRGNSAVDLALWDLLGKSLDQPVWRLLGGLSHDRIPIYNTCAGADYNAAARTGYNTALHQLGEVGKRDFSHLEDLEWQMADPGGLARSLLDEGIRGMKIWPFDALAVASGGFNLSLGDLKKGVGVVEAIRAEVGDAMDIMMEYHSLWRLPDICRIADALDDLDVYWHEDPVPMHLFDDLESFKASTRARVTGSEALGTKEWYAEAFRRGCIDVAHFDLCWIGGLTEGRKIAGLAEAYGRPIAPHDCVGPLTLAASAHLVMSAPNGLIQETVRAFLRGYYRDLVTELPLIENGWMLPMTGAGLGTELLPDIRKREDVRVQRSDGS
jgi:galactonate dehydratase